MRDFFRGVLEWKIENLNLGTSSNESAKMYDASLTQLVGWYDIKSLGGLSETLSKMNEADPDFILGKSLDLGIQLIGTGTNIRLNDKLKQDIDELKNKVDNDSKISQREKNHVYAVYKWAQNDLHSALLIWEDILLEYPTDMHAIKMAQDTYFYLGLQAQMRDSVARVIPFWQSSPLPLKRYLRGMYAFGLQETNLFEKAEKEAKKGLELNKNDGWATHSMAHILEMKGKPQEGVHFLSRTAEDWEVCNHLACHNYWHWALCYIELGEYDAAIDILEKHISKRALESRTMLDIVDMSSLLYRLQLTDPNHGLNGSTINKHWDSAFEICKPHLQDHILGFNDAHFMMACLGTNNIKAAEELLETITDEVSGGKNLTTSLLKAMICYYREDYSGAIELIRPIRYQLIEMGGSNAQRDIFNQLLIMSAIKSNNEHDRKLAEHLLIERKQIKDVSPLTDRLILKLSK